MKSFLLFLWMVVAAGPAWAASGTVEIKGTKEGSTLSGEAALTDTADGLKISASLRNLPPGKHGFHIHENGSCADEGKAAGGHYNPEGAPHGLLSKDGLERAHAGDFGNIEIGPDGTGVFEALLPGLTVDGGKYNVIGKSLILHEKEDDFSQPTGNAGGRIGCGVIEPKGD